MNVPVLYEAAVGDEQAALGATRLDRYLNWFGFINIPFLALTAFLIITSMMAAWALLRRPTTQSSLLDGARLAVIMIAVGVVLSFMVASTFV